MRSFSAAWVPIGVLATVIVAGLLAPARRASPVRSGRTTEGSPRMGTHQGQPVTPAAPLLRYDVPSDPLPSALASTDLRPTVETVRLPGLTSDIRLRPRFAADDRAMDRLVASVDKSDTTASWMMALGQWMGGSQGGLGLFVPKWSNCPRLIAHGEATTGWGMGLQYRLSF